MGYDIYLVLACPFIVCSVFCGVRFYQTRHRLWLVAAVLLAMMTIPPLYFAFFDFMYYSGDHGDFIRQFQPEDMRRYHDETK